ncbi:CAAX prenyl protease 2 isoform X2 [Syzygium oleosum]|uniref:CAAX prenyl protease 2 isoform X2 n=1 Tax=Syzygium oleosum TaxID=219896 RepID=UPI0024B8AFF4|nr:CAAX prenyl protease 2 isoform X2 [Syzygium oleosum]
MEIPSTSPPRASDHGRRELVNFTLPPATPPSPEHRPHPELLRRLLVPRRRRLPLSPPPLGLGLADPAMEEGGGGGPGLSKPAALAACFCMALFYVATLYAPAALLRLPPPPSFKSFMLRRFACAAVSSLVSVVATALVLPIRRWEVRDLLAVYGIRGDHLWQAVVLPLSLTSLMYAGSLALKLLLWVDSWKEHRNCSGCFSFEYSYASVQFPFRWILSRASNILAWRNFVVAPLTEELVFRACMISILLCGGFEKYSILILGPILFSLAHLNHFMEIYMQQKRQIIKASMIIGLQLGYTVVFGSYASFLFIRTGHLLAPLVAHIFCNFMGLPVLFSHRKGIATVAFVAGMMGFLWLLFLMTRPDYYNDRTKNCRCWHAFCSWI